MTHVEATVHIDRPPEQTMPLFDGPISGWLPVIVGPDRETWRTETREGPIRVHVLIHAGSPWSLPDGTHRRTLTVTPDRTSFHDLFVAGLTPRVEGHLRVEPGDDPTTTRLVFEGQTRRRSRITIALERALVGDPLVRSGIDTILEMIAEHLARAEGPSPDDDRSNRPVRVPVPRRRARA